MDKEPMELEFRLGRPDDYEPALEIQRRSYRLKEAPLYGEGIPPLAETPETLAGELAGGKQLMVGVDKSDRVVASLRMQLREDGTAYVCRLSVDPDLQGRGIGQRMMQAFERFFPGAGAFVLDCGVDSQENMHIYSKLGYRLTGEEFQVPNGPLCLGMRKENKP